MRYAPLPNRIPSFSTRCTATANNGAKDSRRRQSVESDTFPRRRSSRLRPCARRQYFEHAEPESRFAPGLSAPVVVPGLGACSLNVVLTDGDECLGLVHRDRQLRGFEVYIGGLLCIHSLIFP